MENENQQKTNENLAKAVNLFKIAEKQTEKKEYKEAIVNYKEAVQLLENYDTHLINNNIAICYYSIHKYTEAMKFFKKVLKENPNFDSAYQNLADCYLEAGRQKAIRILNRGGRNIPNFKETYKHESLRITNPAKFYEWETED